jgi:hypothetical protein
MLMGDFWMLSPLTIVSLDQGKLYGSKPTIDEIDAAMTRDFGLASGDGEWEPATTAKARSHPAWATRLYEWLTARARRPQPEF